MARTYQVLARLGATAAAVTLACFGPEQPATITVTPAAVSLDAIGDTRQLTAKATDKDGKELTGVLITWESSAPTVVAVDDAGKITAIAPGTADVTASAGGVSGKAGVTVTQAISKVEAASGAQQTGTVGQALPQQIVVRVRDRLDHPIQGAAVTFTVQPNGGSVSPASGTTGADGQLAATWTLGTTKGTFQVNATVAGAAQSALFVATANPGPAHNLAYAGGRDQFGFQGSRLAQPVAVVVRDSYGNGVPSHAVTFTPAPGSGTVDTIIVFTDTSGVARVGWRMPNISGVDTVFLEAASVGGGGSPLLGSPVTFTAVAHNVRVISWSPTTLREGQSATLTGSGFDPGNTQNVVTIDGVGAAVTAASATSLTVTVPAYDCRPARNVAVQVTVGGIPAAPATVPLDPALAALNLLAGQQTILTDPTQFCFQFAAAALDETYLIGVQSTLEAASNRQPISLVGTAAAPAAAPPLQAPVPMSLRPAQQGQAISPERAARLERWRRYRAAELAQRAEDRRIFEQLQAVRPPAAPWARQAPLVDSLILPGTNVAIRISTGGGCTTYTEITTVVRAVGAKGIFLEDVANPAGGYADTTFARVFSKQYDDKIHPAASAQFGAPTDSDGNGRIVFVVTKEVNKREGSLGFTTACDLGTRATNPASNEGEFTYIVAPDPNGTVSGRYSLADATLDFPTLLAHEAVHVIQFGRRKAAGATAFLDLWTAEGQAVLGEEIVGHAVLGNAVGANYGLNQIIDTQGNSTVWYISPVVGLGLYFGWDPITTPGTSGRVANAPWECTWLATKYGGPCVGELDVYGTPWSLLRYLSDRFRSTYPGGEPGLHQAIIERPETGFAMLQAVSGVRVDTLLAQWAAMLYVDDITDSWSSVAPTLSLSSWDLDDIFYGTVGNWRLLPELRLTPETLTYSTFSKSAKVRGASTYYAVISGANRSSVAVKARDETGGILPSTMRYWIVRIQ